MAIIRSLRALLVSIALIGTLTLASVAVATTTDAYESDNTAAAAKVIAYGALQQRSTYPAGDVDWIKFSATAGAMYRIETTRATILPDVFTNLELYAPNGTTLLASDYDGAGRYNFSRLVWTAPSTGTYYLKVSGPPLMEGNYALQVLGTAGLRYVRGTLTADDGGAPLEGIEVGASTAGYDLLGRAVTAADGTYAVPLFYDDAYMISFHDPDTVYHDEWYDNAYHPTGRTLVAVGSAGVSEIDAGLTEGAEVTGAVTDELSGDPIAGVNVYLCVSGTLGSAMPIRETVSGPDGSYRFSALDGRAYTVAFEDPDGVYRSEIHDGLYWSGFFEAGAFTDATWVDVALGASVTVDASLLEKPTLSGRLTNASAAGLAGRTVTVGVVTPAAVNYPRVTTTGADGSWTAAVDGPGQYWIKFTDTSGSYVSEYFDDVPFTDPESQTPVNVAGYGTHLTGLDAELAPAGTIWGYVKHSGTPVPGVTLAVFLQTDTGWRRVDASGVTRYDGMYTVGGLPPGETFCLQYAGSNTIPEYTGNAPSLDLASSFQVNASSPYRYDVDMMMNPYRAAGPDRYMTAVQGSRATFPSGVTRTVVLASGTGFADALSASALAGAVDGPVLLASRYSVPQAVLDEITRLGATDAYVIGGPSVMDESVLRAIDALPGMAYPTRVAGADRYETSAKVAETVAALDGVAFSHSAFIARGDTYPDALAAGPFAYSQGMPVLLTRPSELPDSIAAAIESLDITSTIICGDTTAVSADVASDVEALNSGGTSTLRRGGTTRYDTAAVIAQHGIAQGWCSDYYRPFGYATGMNYPDALSGASTLGARNGCLMLVKPTWLPGSVRDAIAANKTFAPRTLVLGDTGVVSDSVVAEIEAALVLPYE